ncbi:hypothetical protein ACJX0J_038987 [Zea mays]
MFHSQIMTVYVSASVYSLPICLLIRNRMPCETLAFHLKMGLIYILAGRSEIFLSHSGYFTLLHSTLYNLSQILIEKKNILKILFSYITQIYNKIYHCITLEGKREITASYVSLSQYIKFILVSFIIMLI